MDRPTTCRQLLQIEATYAGLPGEASPAQSALAIRAKLAKAREAERDAVTRFQLPDVALAGLFFALCARYEIKGDVASARSRNSVHVVAPPSFVRDVFAPIFETSALAVLEHLVAHTDAIINDAYGLVAEGPALIVRPRSK